MKNLFEKAKQHITPALIKQYTDSPGSIQAGNEFKTLNPMRADKNIGSFAINLQSGHWYDHATSEGGDMFKLMAVVDGITEKQAAEKVLKAAGAWTPPLPPAVIVTRKALQELNTFSKQSWLTKTHGNPTAGWSWRNEKGEIEYCQIRYTRQGADDKIIKTDLPFYYDGEKWHQKLPPDYKKTRLPLYGIENLTPEITKIILVEGAKCGSVEIRDKEGIKIPGLEIMSWGGSSQTGLRRWKPLQKRKDIQIVIWPDKDMQVDKATGKLLPKEKQPGLKAALDIKNKYLPWAKILDPWAYDENNELESGYDIADAEKDGLDLEKFINECPEYVSSPAESRLTAKGQAPFKFLGYDNTNFWYMPSGAPYPFKIPQRGINKVQLLNIACRDFWFSVAPNTNFNAVDWEGAFDWLIRQSQASGWFDPARVRGAGIWKDGENIYCNTGREIITPEGEQVSYENTISEKIYTQATIDLKSIKSGPIATPDQGKLLKALFEVQGFETRLQAWEALGWSLMAPFGGVLDWRPCLWLTGKAGSGKSFTIENIILPMSCEFAVQGSGESTAASVRRDAGSGARAIFLDETEKRGGNKHYNAQKMNTIIDIIRNSCSNASNSIRQVGPDGVTVEYKIYSTFLLASVVPTLDNQAIEGRFFVPVLQKVPIKTKRENTYRVLKSGVLDDPGIFVRRSFKNIKQILKNISWLKKELSDVLYDQRMADNYSTIFAFIFSLENEGKIEDSKFISEIWDMIQEIGEKRIQKDEDTVLEIILQSKLKKSPSEEVTVSSIITRYLDSPDGGVRPECNDILSPNGMHITHTGFFVVAYNNRYINDMFRGTDYHGSYGTNLKRHDLACKDGLVQVHIEGKNTKCVSFSTASIIEILGWQKKEITETESGDLPGFVE